MSVADVIQAAWPRLSPAERRVAEAVRRDPEAVAFGTVARVGERAGTSGPSVLRLAGKLGYTGFVGLQAAVRSDLSERLRPAVERIRSPLRAPLLERALDVESENLRRTLAGLDPRRFDAAVRRLGDPKRRVTILPSEQCAGVASLFAGELALLRDGVRIVHGSEFRVATQLAALRRGDVVLLVDLARHERWVLRANEWVVRAGASRIVVTDTARSPLASGAKHVLVVAAESAGPFDSNVGVLALLNALVAGVASLRRREATRRIDALEATWVETQALSD